MALVFLDSLFILFLQWHFMLICQMYGYQARVLNNVTTTKSSAVQSTLRPVDGDSTAVLINTALAKALGGIFASILIALLGYFFALCCKYRKTADITDKLRKSYNTNFRKNKASFGCCYDHCLCFGLRGVYKIFFSQCECSCYCKSNSDDHERLLSIESYDGLMSNDDKCQSIKYKELMEMCNHYGKYDIKHKNFCYFASCKNNGHSEFLIRKGLQMIPIIYYFVLDWNDSEIKLLGSEKYDERDIDVIRVITNGEPSKRATRKTKMFKKVEAVIQILQESKKSICIVLLDFPTTMQSEHETALNFVFDFIKRNNIKICYKCKRPSPSQNDNVGESSELLDSPTPKDIRDSLIAVESKVEKKDNISIEMLPSNQDSHNKTDETKGEISSSTQNEDNSVLLEAIKEVRKWHIEKLPYRKKIGEILDVDKSVVMTIGKHCGFNNNDLKALEPNDAGGGNPALSFYQTLQSSNYDKLVKKLRQFFLGKNKKAFNVLKEYPDGAILEHIKPLDIHNLATFTTTLAGDKSSNWVDVAEFYGMGDKVPQFESAVRHGNNYSLTTALLNKIDTKYFNEIAIGVLHDNVEKVNKLAAEEIQNQITLLAKQLLSENDS